MGGSIDPTLRALKSVGRYQLLQVLVINLGYFGAAYQLLGNIFIGKSHSSSSSSSSSSSTPQSSHQWGTYSRRPTSGVLTADIPPAGYLQQTSQRGSYSRRPTSGVVTTDVPPVRYLQQTSHQRGTHNRRPTSGVLTTDVPPVGYLQQTSHQWGIYSRRPTSGVLKQTSHQILEQTQQLGPLPVSNKPHVFCGR